MQFKLPLLFLFLPTLVLASTASTLPYLQYPLTRRGESFPAPDVANLTFLLSALDAANVRFNATVLSPQARTNTLSRKPRRMHGTQACSILLGDVGLDGSWFTNLRIGTPAQEVDMDIDMLATDWWILSTTSGKGSFFLDFNSHSYRDSKSGLAFPTCREPSDMMHLPGARQEAGIKEVEVTFAHCRPAKQWIRTLLPSGAHLGLAPGVSLSQTKTKGLLERLLEKGAIDVPVFSLRVLSGTSGMLSVGGASATKTKKAGERKAAHESTKGKDVSKVLGLTGGQEAVKGYDLRDGLKDDNTVTAVQLPVSKDKEIKHQETRRDSLGDQMVMPLSYSKEGTSAEEWKWIRVQGPEGWWQTTMSAVWIGGRRVLQNQLIVLDINTPFILAPPSAARSFYASISGSRRLPVPYDQLYAYPCLNPPQIQFEFGQDFKVRVLKGKRDKGTFSPGGRFSLGRMALGSGYCVGIVVESRMGLKVSPTDDENGLEDIWVLGEPFFKDCHVAFDWRDKKIGFQRA